MIHQQEKLRGVVLTAIVSSVEKVDITKNGADVSAAVGGIQTNGGNASESSSAGAIGVILNGKVLNFEQPPVIEDGTTLVPMIAIFEAMGASVDWNNDTKTVTSVKGNTTVSITLNNSTATVNGKTITLAVPGKLINGSTMVPLRFVSESLGAEVNWDGAQKL